MRSVRHVTLRLNVGCSSIRMFQANGFDTLNDISENAVLTNFSYWRLGIVLCQCAYVEDNIQSVVVCSVQCVELYKSEFSISNQKKTIKTLLKFGIIRTTKRFTFCELFDMENVCIRSFCIAKHIWVKFYFFRSFYCCFFLLMIKIFRVF